VVRELALLRPRLVRVSLLLEHPVTAGRERYSVRRAQTAPEGLALGADGNRDLAVRWPPEEGARKLPVAVVERV